MHQDLQRSLNSLSDLDSVLGEVETLIHICFDCLEYRPIELEKKLDLLLECISSRVELASEELPERIREIEVAIELLDDCPNSEDG